MIRRLWDALGESDSFGLWLIVVIWIVGMLFLLLPAVL